MGGTTGENLPTSLIEFDSDGALQETAEKLTRRSAISAAALLTIGGVGINAVLADESFALATKSRGRDYDLLNFALSLEYLEADFYRAALKSAGLTGPLLELTRTVRDHENSHVRFITNALGRRKYVGRPKFKFGALVSNPTIFHQVAIKLEDTGVEAYSGAAPTVFSPTVLAAAASILTVEARHAAAFRQLAGLNPAPDDFDLAINKGQVDSRAKKLKVGYKPIKFRYS